LNASRFINPTEVSLLYNMLSEKNVLGPTWRGFKDPVAVNIGLPFFNLHRQKIHSA